MEFCIARSNASWARVTCGSPRGQNDGQIQLKTLPSRNFVGGGKNCVTDETMDADGPFSKIMSSLDLQNASNSIVGNIFTNYANNRKERRQLDISFFSSENHTLLFHIPKVEITNA